MFAYFRPSGKTAARWEWPHVPRAARHAHSLAYWHNLADAVVKELLLLLTAGPGPSATLADVRPSAAVEGRADISRPAILFDFDRRTRDWVNCDLESELHSGNTFVKS